MGDMRIGFGYDSHRFDAGRRLVLGGVEIPGETGLRGHSDADVVLHAVIDALLGAAALGDIGKLFPDSDPAYKGIDSRVLLRETVKLVRNRDMCVKQIDTVILCQRPKLRDHIDSMRANLALDLEIPLENVSVKATTTEGMNDEGKGLCISAQAICRLRSA
jgi:2-C-methyl-D-erythritol 2,4-cyclodiphosphate synthase